MFLLCCGICCRCDGTDQQLQIRFGTHNLDLAALVNRGFGAGIPVFAVQVDPRSLTGPVIVINEVLVDGAQLTAEQKGTGTNLKQLMDGMKSTAPHSPWSRNILG